VERLRKDVPGAAEANGIGKLIVGMFNLQFSIC
jgi:hypothetical protein